MPIKLKNVRIAFPHLFKRNDKFCNPGEGKFEATFLLHKERDADLIKSIQDEIKSRIKNDLKQKSLPSDKICLRDGDDSDRAEFAGHWTLKAANTRRPTVVDRKRNPLAEEDGAIYGGCWVNGMVDLWNQNNEYGKRINCNLLGVQFFKDGEPFGDSVTACADDFDMFDDDDEDIPF